ncbi:hypothetical protein V5H98_15355 [Georgenia sp. M64]|uniref:hypothetical protein n=1 Tax=Georgenia sp. M64 TaxID=3120520 RepID=UPI0030E5D11C
MSTLRVDEPRPAPSPVHVTLDVAAWSLVLGVLRRDLPDLPLPDTFVTPVPLAPGQRRAAWRRLTSLGLATAEPGSPGKRGSADQRDDPDEADEADDPDEPDEPDEAAEAAEAAEATLADLAPGFVAGLALFALPGLRIRVSATVGDVALTQMLAWDGDKAVALSRRRRSTGTGSELEPAVDLTFLDTASLLAQVMLAVPADPPGHRGAGRPITLAWPTSVAVATALREGRDDVARHLADLPPEALTAVGAVACDLVGAVDVGVERVGPVGHPVAAPTHRAVWLWTGPDVVRLTAATAEEVTLRLSSRADVEDDVARAVTALGRGVAGPTPPGAAR